VDDPDTRILDRSTPVALSPHLDRAAGVIERTVNYGTHLLVKCDKAGAGRPLAVPVLLTRRIIEMGDAVSVLYRRRCIDPTLLLIRSQFEFVCQLSFIAKGDVERKCRQYEVAHAHARIQEHQRHDSTTELGRQAMAELRKDEIFRDMDLGSYSSDEPVLRLEGMLKKPEHAEVEAEWQRIRAERKAKKAGTSIAWYSLYKGPGRIQDLAREVGRAGEYEFIYRLCSNYAHGSNSMLDVEPRPGEGFSYRPLRYPLSLVPYFHFAMSHMLAAYRALHSIYLPPAAMKDYGKWYTEAIRSDFKAVGRLTINDPDRRR
jgi:hypothetical protein